MDWGFLLFFSLFFLLFLDHLTAFHLYNQVLCLSCAAGRFSLLVSQGLLVGKGKQLLRTLKSCYRAAKVNSGTLDQNKKKELLLAHLCKDALDIKFIVSH